jgi:ribosomal protein S16
MDKKLVIKTFKIRKHTRDRYSRIIVVGYNTSKVDGSYLDKIGVYGYLNTNISVNLRPKIVCSINLRKLGFWLNKGAIVKSKTA